MTRLLRMYPSLLKVGFASAMAYRAEFFVWVLTTNLPLINLALWTAVARDAPVGRFGQAEFGAYFLATLPTAHPEQLADGLAPHGAARLYYHTWPAPRPGKQRATAAM